MAKSRVKYVFVMGGVLSGLGKGIAVSSIARLLQSLGYRVSAMKIDPYVNVDAGTMNPTEHGEVFVTTDGLESDQDIGNYERFLQTKLTRESYMTTGQVYLSVIRRERNLDYHGKSVQVVPHIPNEVIRRIKAAAAATKSEILIVEIGGTVGEYENLLFLEAARMMHLSDPANVQFVLLSYLPIPAKLGEMKTKPTQHAVRSLNMAGLHPDFILCRAERSIDRPRRDRISSFCNVHSDDVIAAPDVNSVYEVPLQLGRQRLAEKILAKFHLRARRHDMSDWKRMVRRSGRRSPVVRIAMVGKYFSTGDFTLADSYLSVIESLKHAAWKVGVQPQLTWLDAERYEKDPSLLKELRSFDGIVVPGGFGSRGTEGTMLAIRFAREHRIPYLGLCYGLQLAVVEFSRSVLRLRQAQTTEINPRTPDPVIDVMPDQRKNVVERQLGGTMRLGSQGCRLQPGSIAARAYGRAVISERHRHRYEVNNHYVPAITAAGFRVSGWNTERKLVEIMELDDHPFFVGVQFHPEFQSYPLKPHPLFSEFIKTLHRRNKKSARVSRAGLKRRP